MNDPKPPRINIPVSNAFKYLIANAREAANAAAVRSHHDLGCYDPDVDSQMAVIIHALCDALEGKV